MSKGSIPLGTMDVPPGWSATTEIVVTEEVKRAPKTPLHPALEKEAAPARVTVVREPIDPRYFKMKLVLNNFMGKLADGAQSFELIEEGPVAFTDGVEGWGARVKYETGLGVVLQRHAIRVDGDVATRFVASLEWSRAEKLKDIDRLICSFRPLTEKS